VGADGAPEGGAVAEPGVDRVLARVDAVEPASGPYGTVTYYFKRPAPRPVAPVPQGPPPAKGEVKAFRLKHADVAKTTTILQQLMGEGKGIRIIADEAAKQVLVQAPVDDLFEVAKILQLLDVPPEK
jgi:hypothetical protein